ncbi:30S ribosomal protein S8 [Microgenomates group bacterium RIFCSPLOWO2_01_FULL_47_10]|nr:ribosomal protein S8 [uncultured bacterium]OGV92387.1 MAG: 30S ribosomal protein S8 [Microgenomates group bacterium RIFCSPLOWO2_01_FULL_47_10]
MTDPIADMLTRIRNAYAVGHKVTAMPFSGLKASVAQILVESGYLVAAKKIKSGAHFQLEITLKYVNTQPAISHISRISMPGRRLYVKANHLPRTLSGYGTAIISTSQGVMSVKDARKCCLGGELICQVW